MIKTKSKKILSLLLTLCMVLSLLPTVAFAADVTYAASHNWTDVAKEQDTAYTNEGGQVKLNSNVTITGYIGVQSGDLTIDLGGNEIKRTGGATVFYITGGSLTVKGPGKITSDGSGSIVVADGSSTVISFDGVDVTASESNTNAMINADNNAHVTIKDGKITNPNQDGNAIAAASGAKIELTGTKIETKDGCALYANNDNSEIKATNVTVDSKNDKNTVAAVGLENGGKIVLSGSTSVTSKSGYAVSVGVYESCKTPATLEVNDDVTMTKTEANDVAVVVGSSSKMIMNGGTITAKGKALQIQQTSTVDFKNGTIERTEAQVAETGEPAVIVITGSKFNMENGTISGSEIGIQVQDSNSKAIVSGGTIKSSDEDGAAAVAVTNGSEFEMTDGIIQSNGQGLSVGKTKDAGDNNPAKATVKGSARIICEEKSGFGEVQVGDNGTLTIQGDAAITGGIAVFDQGTLNIEGGTITSNSFGISTNGSKSENSNITISGGTVTGADDACGVYLPAGTLTVKDTANISGGSGIVVRGGDLKVEGGTIKSTGTDTITVGDAKKEGDARYPIPVAGITVDKHESYKDRKVTISGDSAVIMGAPTVIYTVKGQSGTQPDGSKDKIEISAGTFKGGNLPSDITNFLADEKAAHKQDNDSYKVEQKWDPKLTSLTVSDVSVSSGLDTPANDSGTVESAALTAALEGYPENFTITAEFSGEAKYGDDVGTVKAQGTALTSGTASAPISFGAGEWEKIVYICVTADGKDGYYKLTVTRQGTNAEVTAVEGTFDSKTTLTGEIGADKDGSSVAEAIPVTFTVPKDTKLTDVTVKLTVDDAKAKVNYKNDTGVADNSSINTQANNDDGSVEIKTVDFSSNKPLYVKVDSEDGKKTVIYKITVEQTAYEVEMAETSDKGVNESIDNTVLGAVKTAVTGTKVAEESEDALTQAVISAVEANKSLAGESAGKLDAETALNYFNTQLSESESSVNIFAVPYLDITVGEKGYEQNGDTYTLDVTPRYYVVATKDSVKAVDSITKLWDGVSEDKAGADAVKLNKGEDPVIEGLKNVTVKITLPDGFNDDATVYVRVGGDKYETEYTAVSKAINVVFPHFSEVVISKNASGEATIGKVTYDTLQDAINAVTNSGTINLTSAVNDKGYGAGTKLNAPVTNSDEPFTFTIAANGSSVTVGEIEFNTTTSDGYIYTARNDNGKVTVTRERAPSAPSDSGGGVGSSATVNSVKATNGSFAISDKNAKAGDTVKITPKANDGYVVDTVTVTDKNGNNITVTQNADGTYSFVMPAKSAQPVDVKVTFKLDDGEKDCPSEKFTDVDQDKWYHEGVDYAIKNGLMNGTGADTFAPDATTTRAMVVTILYRLDGEPAVTKDIPFADVPAGQWYSNAINWAAANGIVDGYGNGKFGPDDTITREQMAAILYRYASYKGYSVSDLANLTGYTDAASVSEWASTAMRWAVAEGLIEGTSATTLSPSGDSTRAQVATILMRFCEGVVK